MELFEEFCPVSKPERYDPESTYRDGEKAGAEFEDNFSETLWEIRLKVVRTRLPIGRLRVVAFPSTTSWVRLHAIGLHAGDNAPCIPSPMDGLCPVLMPLARR